MARGRWNGGIIGPNLKVTTSSASGIFSLSEAQVDVSAGLLPQAPIPVIIPPDSQFNLTTLLLHGDGSNGAQNNTFLDGSTNAFTVTRNGTPTQGTFSPFSQTGWSNYMGTTTTGLTTPASSMTNIIGSASTSLSTATFTIEAWIFQITRHTLANVALMCGDMNIGGGEFDWGFGPSSTGYLEFSWYDGSLKYCYGDVLIPLNTWTHIALTISSGSIKMFVNGVLQSLTGTTTTTNAASTLGYFTVGGYTNSGTTWYGYNGYVSNLRVVKSALYSTTFTPSTSPLTATANTSLLICQSNRFADASTNNYTITPYNSVTIVQPFGPFAPGTAYGVSSVGGSMWFNNTSDYLSYTDTVNGFGTGDFTIECWVYSSSVSQNILYNSTTSNNWAVIFYNQQVYWQYNGSNIFNTSSSVQLSAWNHIALVRSSSTLTIYINGVSGASATVSTNIPTPSGSKYVGPGGGGAGGYYLSNVRIVKGTAVYTGTFTPPTAPVTAIANTSLLVNGTNAAIYDSTAKNVITTAGSAQISTSQSQYGASSMAFNGSTDYLLLPHNQNLVFGSGNFTMECWIYVTSAALNGLYAKRATNGTFAGIVWYVSGTNVLTLYMTNTGSSWQISGATGATTITQNAWHHVALVRNGSTINMFVDGAVDYTGSFTGSVFDGGAAVTLGAADAAAATWPFHGYIDDMRITTGYAKYTSAFTPPTASFANQ